MKSWNRPPQTRTRRPLGRRRVAVRPVLEGLEVRLVLSNVDILTYRNDLSSNGVNSAETALSPVNVKLGSFGKLYSTTLDGIIYAQPLLVNDATITAGVNTVAGATGLHDVTYVATEHDSLYALDSHTGAVLWKRSFLDVTNVGGNLSNMLGASSITTLTNLDTHTSDQTEVGITSTPVIDKANGIIYVLPKTKEIVGSTPTFAQRLHAINLSNGTDVVTPYQIGTTTGNNNNTTQIYSYGAGAGNVIDPYNGTGKALVQFNALKEGQRSALSLVNGKVYAEWASHGDNGPYHGWVVMFDVSNITTSGIKLGGAFNLSPNGSGAGVWESGAGLTFDSSGAAYLATGNGFGSTSNPVLDANGFPADGNYYEAVVKLVADPNTSPTNQNINGWGLKAADYFIPSNILALDNVDQDLGSGGPLPLPDSAGIPGHPHLLVMAGKQGVVYLIDRDNMGKFNPTADQVVSEANLVNKGVLSTPSYFNGKLYYSSGYSGNLRSFTIQVNGKLVAASQSNPNGLLGYLPGSVSISANGTTGGIVWALDRNTNALRAYDATAMTTELWNSNQAAQPGRRTRGVGQVRHANGRRRPGPRRHGEQHPGLLRPEAAGQHDPELAFKPEGDGALAHVGQPELVRQFDRAQRGHRFPRAVLDRRDQLPAPDHRDGRSDLDLRRRAHGGNHLHVPRGGLQRPGQLGAQ